MLKIANCDDDKNYINEVSALLSNIPCKIFTFFSGKELIECKNSFDLIFLDIVMSEMDGIETLKHIENTYIIFM